jgi:hypothetical protein
MLQIAVEQRRQEGRKTAEGSIGGLLRKIIKEAEVELIAEEASSTIQVLEQFWLKESGTSYKHTAST